MPLTNARIHNATPLERPYKLSDSGGLFLLVQPNGAKYWRQAYRFNGKQKTIAHGVFPAIGLAKARELRDEAKATLKKGIDPAGPSKPKPGDDLPADAFEKVAREWYKAKSNPWTHDHRLRIEARLERDAFPDLGKLPIGEIDAPTLLSALRKVEQRGALDIARRLRQTFSAIFRYAIATGRAQRDPAADLKGALTVPPRVQHMASLPADQIKPFLGKLNNYDGERQTALAIRLALHTALRTNELRFGRWRELSDDLWRIPAERMKAGREHLVPLSTQTKDILKALYEIADGSEWILPGARTGKPISENTMLYGLYRMGYHSRLTVHGFRSTFSTIANESGLWTADAIERSLAHVPGNIVRATYNHALYLDERRRLMQWWSDRLTAEDPHDLSKLLT